MSNMNGKQRFEDVYALIAELWCSPPEAEPERAKIRKGAEQVIGRLENNGQEVAIPLSRFIEENAVREEEYIDLFELNPQCALYLGSHAYDEPTTCATAGVSDRNAYMIELVGIYNHFGRKPNGQELPDYLPLMVDFLSLTVESVDDPVRDKLIDEYILPFLAPMRRRLEELKTPYRHLLDALEKAISLEQETRPLSKRRDQKVESHVG